MKLALVGATGLVGSVMLRVLEELKINISEFYPAASAASAGKKVVLNNKEYHVISVEDALSRKPHVAIFSAGATISRIWAKKFTSAGTFVIDNSSAWRMNDDVPLVVPEVNTQSVSSETRLIANPNCSTIQLVVALHPIHKNFGLKRLVVATYQSVTGTGVKAVKQMDDERQGKDAEKVYPYPIDLNCLPHGGDFLDNGYTAEEMKLVNETRKILGDHSISITSTVVRIPVKGGHSEAVNVETMKPFSIEKIKDLLLRSPGIVIQDDPQNNIYPMPLFAEGKNSVFIGRIRKDLSIENGLDMWVVADNLRKGAATNAVQILSYLTEKGLIPLS